MSQRGGRVGDGEPGGEISVREGGKYGMGVDFIKAILLGFIGGEVVFSGGFGVVLATLGGEVG